MAEFSAHLPSSCTEELRAGLKSLQMVLTEGLGGSHSRGFGLTVGDIWATTLVHTGRSSCRIKSRQESWTQEQELSVAALVRGWTEAWAAPSSQPSEECAFQQLMWLVASRPEGPCVCCFSLPVDSAQQGRPQKRIHHAFSINTSMATPVPR